MVAAAHSITATTSRRSDLPGVFMMRLMLSLSGLSHYYWSMKAMRLLKKIALVVIGGILAVYLLLAIGLTALEWIVRDNPKVEESLQAHSTEPHRLTHFDQGAASFHRRLELIASAKKSVRARVLHLQRR